MTVSLHHLTPRVLAMPRLHNLAVAVALVALVGCPKSAPPPPPPQAPEILSFPVSASVVKPGETVTLSWQTQHASAVELRDVALGLISGASGAQGSVEVAVNESALFVLTARNERGLRETAAVSVSVIEGSGEVLFAAAPSQVSAGEAAVLAWLADGAKEVSLAVKGGGAVDLGGQKTAGTVRVTPLTTTTWVLTADGRAWEATVKVAPVIQAVGAVPQAVTPGEPVTIGWATLGAARVTVEGVGRGVLHSEENPSAVADGSFTEVIPAADPAQVFSYLVHAHGPDGAVVTRILELYVAGQPAVLSWTVPPFAPEGGTFTASWTTREADAVEIQRDGLTVYRSIDRGDALAGSVQLQTPATEASYQLVALHERGGSSQSASKVVGAVGLPQLVSFEASPQPGVQYGGEPVTLSWEVTHARNVKIVEAGGRLVGSAYGVGAASGSVEVYPNKDTAYVLTADNSIGDAIAPVTRSATVATPARLQFSHNNVPAGSPIQLTGSTVTGGVGMAGRNFGVAKNLPSEGFVDILTTGTALTIGPTDDTVSYLITLPEPFITSVAGTPVTSSTVSVSINGWMVFSPTTVTGPSVPGTLPATTIPALSIAPYFKDLQADGSTKVLWQLDGAGLERRLIVQWDDNRYYASTTKRVTFQAQIYQSGEIVFAYGKVAGLLTTDTVAIGVQNHDSTGAVRPEPSMLTNTQPAAGDTFRFFGEFQLPYTVAASSTKLHVDVLMPGGGFVEILDAPSLIPPNQFAITEVNYNPAPGQEQWFEVVNNTSSAIDLGGWTIDFGGGWTHLIAGPVQLPAGGILLFGQSADSAEGSSGGPMVDYVYGQGLVLPAAAGSISIGMAGGTYTQLPWTSAGTAGVALQSDSALSPNLMLAAGVPALVCPATASYGASGQKGTPGASNSRCFPYDLQPTVPNGFEPIAATGTWVSPLTSSSDETFGELLLPRPVSIFGQPQSTLWVSSNGLLTFVPITSAHLSNNTVVATTVPNGVLAPFWDDLVGKAGGTVMWQQFDPDGTPGTGDEYTLVSWEGWQIYNVTSTVNFQVRFIEATGDIEFHYGVMTSSDTGGARAKGSSATTWLENAAGTAALKVNVDSATSPGIQPDTGFRFAYQP